MRQFTTLVGVVAPLDQPNVDTDQIIPKQFLKSIQRTGFGSHLFYDWRYIGAAQNELSGMHLVPNPAFILNQERYKEATILLARENFGCGSSREHAPWALFDYGFRAVIAPSFGQIFLINALKNGLLAIQLPGEQVNQLFSDASAREGFRLGIDLAAQTVSYEDSDRVFCFEIDPFIKYCLHNGLDEIALTLQYAGEIEDYERQRAVEHPWVFH